MLLLASMVIVAQSRILRSQRQINNFSSGRGPHISRLRASDTPEGSRVVLTSDLSLNDYEAYRRGDRFYLRIPASDVPRAEAVRGRGFADVKVQQNKDSTVISFRLQPGTSAHVEQRANGLEIVFTTPGAPRAATESKTKSREKRRMTSSQTVEKNNAERATTSANFRSHSPALPKNSSLATKAASPDTTSSPTDAGAASAVTSPPSATGKSPAGTPAEATSSTPATSPTVAASSPVATPAGKTSLTSAASPGVAASPLPAQQSADAWAHLKERVRYWILLAQLNPIPIAVGAAVMVMLIALLSFQRRRAKATRRVKGGPGDSEGWKSASVGKAVAARPAAGETSAAKPQAGSRTESTVAEAATGIVATAVDRPEQIKGDETSKTVEKGGLPSAVSPVVENARKERVARVAGEVTNVLAGGDYDRSIVGSDDRETRQLVSAELLSALVGRNLERRERARVAFMKHGYFDDATSDLRIAESPTERAAAARRLSFVGDRDATPHLIGALDDSEPEVRRAAAEALSDLRDPAAIGPLNALLKTEKDRKVPLAVIKHAIESCATSSAEEEPSAASSSSFAPAARPKLPLPPVETEREVIEI